jgi:hypothetical protein
MSGLVPLVQFPYYAFYPWLLIKSTGKVLTRSKIKNFIQTQVVDNKYISISQLKSPFAGTISQAIPTMPYFTAQYQPTPGIVNYSLTCPECCV